MIEVYDFKDMEPKRLDITSELAIAAYNTLIQFCFGQIVYKEGCLGCILQNQCQGNTDNRMAYWEEVHYPKLVDNSVFYLKDGKVKQITHGNRQEAEETFKEMMRR